MATRATLLAPSSNTDTLFRAWINEINNALIAFGWLATSDTGQINFSTVTHPLAINTYQGYAVYKMNDALQATCAVYLRLDFGTGGTTDDPAIKFQITVGGTDGAGNLTGSVQVQVTTSPSGAAASATTAMCRSSGSTSAFRMSFWAGAGIGLAHGWTLAIERDKDSSGADTALGVCIAWFYNSNNISTAFGLGSQFIGADGTYGPVDTGRLYAMVTNTGQQSGGSSKSVGPIHCAAGSWRNAMTGLLLTSRPDWINESTNSVFIYGTVHTYLFMRLGPNTFGLNVWNSDNGMAMLWE